MAYGPIQLLRPELLTGVIPAFEGQPDEAPTLAAVDEVPRIEASTREDVADTVRSEMPPPPLPNTVATVNQLVMVLKGRGWSLKELEFKILKMPMGTYLQDHSLDELYDQWRKALKGQGG
jgi:hypothetical protein